MARTPPPITRFARELLGGTERTRMLRRNLAVIPGVLMVVLAALYVQAETSRITSREEIILDALVDELSRKTGEDEKKIWRRVTAQTGLPARQWYYDGAVDMLTQEIEQANMSKTH